MPDVTNTLASIGIATSVTAGLAALAAGAWKKADRDELRDDLDDERGRNASLRQDLADRDRRLDEKDRIILEKNRTIEAAEAKARALAATVTAEAAVEALTRLLTDHVHRADQNAEKILSALATIREAVRK